MGGNMYVLQLKRTLNLVGPENVNVDQVYWWTETLFGYLCGLLKLELIGK